MLLPVGRRVAGRLLLLEDGGQETLLLLRWRQDLLLRREGLEGQAAAAAEGRGCVSAGRVAAAALVGVAAGLRGRELDLVGHGRV